ncbi:nucleoid-associated protein [Clostridium thermarum]|uniref:nucleoid-associated protein n=1 Tax=Clostridium thermarum TaxID=1716543 RepID=UPI0013D25794|nr:nucleoid-associated protein [Clostridium thermarum]
MEYINEVNINEAIVHILDVNSDEPILNEYPLELNEEVHKFVLRHVERALKDEELKYALFNSGRGIIKEVTQEYLNGHCTIIEASQEIARTLFGIMKTNSSIPSCDLMVVAFSTEFGPMLGLFKMDYVKNYTHKIDFVDNRMSIKIIPQATGLPVSAQKIQKCAFIRPMTEEANYHLMVIDKQGKKGEGDEYGAKYFLNSFLGCTLINSKRDLTKSFLNAAENWTRANAVNDAVKAENIRSTIKKSLKEEDHIDIRELSSNIFEDEYEKQAFVAFVQSQGIEEKLPVDKQWVEKKLKRIRLKIDKEIDLYIDADTYHDSRKFEIIRNGDGSINMVIKHVMNYIEK